MKESVIREIIEEEPLTQEDIKKLSPHISQYVVPHKQAEKLVDPPPFHSEISPKFRKLWNATTAQHEKHTGRYGFIFYNTEQREDGAEEQANNLQQALSETGCDVIKAEWGHTRELQKV